MPKQPTRPNSKPDVAPVRLDLTHGERDRLRVAASLAGVSMAAFARNVVVAAVAKALEKISEKSLPAG
jgi:hypothetical protein